MKIYPSFGLWPFICKFSFYMDMMKGCKKHSKCAGFKESCNNSCQFFFGTNLGLLAIYPYFNSWFRMSLCSMGKLKKAWAWALSCLPSSRDTPWSPLQRSPTSWHIPSSWWSIFFLAIIMYYIYTQWLCCHMKWQWHMKNEEWRMFSTILLTSTYTRECWGGTSCSWMFFSQKLDLIYIIVNFINNRIMWNV